MADAKIINYGQPIGAGSTAIPDNTAVALDISSTDAKDYIVLNTTNNSEQILLRQPTVITDSLGPGGNVAEAGTGADTLIIDSSEDGGLSIVGQPNDPMRFHFVADDYDYRSGILAKAKGSGGGASTRYMNFYTGGQGRMLLNQTGLGIGTTTPATKIDCRGAITYYSGTGTDTATTEPVYLADGSATNDTLVIDFSKGNFGDVTLTRNIDFVRFHFAPADGSTTTVTAKIIQDSSVRALDYSDSAVSVYSDASTGVTGEIKFAGGAHHVQSTGSGAVDLVSFTCIPSGSTFNIYAAVVGQAFA